MQTAIQGTELSVAILMDDLSSAKEIAQSLRQFNIFAHHYQNLDEFWVASDIQVPDLVVVDVTKMSLGSVQFRQHPKVVDGSMTYIFFSKDTTKILLQSTLGLKPYGYVHDDITLGAQVKTLVERRIQEVTKTHQLKDLESRVERLQSRSKRLISDRSSAEEFKAHFEFIKNFCSEIEADSQKSDFARSLFRKLEKWDAITAYGMYELNQSGQKLVAPEVTQKKFHPFPSLWLGQTNQHGVEEFAQDMGTQVANDLFENEPVMIRIHAGNKNPDMLLFLESNEERMKDFPWEVFESSLSSSLRRLKLYQQLPQYSSQFLPMWEAMDFMDRLQKESVDSDTRIICLSLVPLTDVAKRKTQNKFYWSSFFNDFFLQLSGRIQKTTKLSLFGPWHVIFFIPKEGLETEFQMLDKFIRQFSYWKFFEDNSQVLAETTLPSLKLIPPSSAHYLRIFEKEFAELALNQEEKRLMTPKSGDRRLPV